MQTKHIFFAGDARDLKQIPDNSIELMVTSPPYPMIEMWDETFSNLNPEIAEKLSLNEGFRAFELMHCELDKAWKEVFRVLKKGGIACINIGDATRSLGSNFSLYPNHSRILESCRKIGFSSLPSIIWRKETNSPNKFMGSGMLPPGAYVTLEHEHILILRKKTKREFNTPEEKKTRRESAFFWEERNNWFSDVWLNLKGTRQKIAKNDLRKRSGSFPFELAYRLVSMFSVKGDNILDPFAGLGTVMLAAMCSERNSISIDIEENLRKTALEIALDFKSQGNQYIKKRVEKHLDFVRERNLLGKTFKYQNYNHDFPVITRQEREIKFNIMEKIEHEEDNSISVSYSPFA